MQQHAFVKNKPQVGFKLLSLKTLKLFLFQLLILVSSLEVSAQEVTSQELLLQELTSQEVLSQELTSQELMSKVKHEQAQASFNQRALWLSDGIVSSVMQENNIAGLTLSIVKDGEIVLSKGYGYASLAPKTSVDADLSLFRIGSVSKTFTWLAIMQLVEQGKIDLHADVNQYLNSIEIPSTFGQVLTLNDIMAHRSGFEDGGAGYLTFREAKNVPSLETLLAEHMPEQVRQPGEAVAYSNYASALAGRIVENVSGLSFNEYLETNIFQPLGMHQTTFREYFAESGNFKTINEKLLNDYSASFSLSAGRHVDFGFEYISHFGPAGAGASSASDMARFMIALLQEGELDGQRILSEKSITQMRTRNFNDRNGMTGFAHGFFNGKVQGHEYFGHGGATSSFRTMMMVFPELEFGVFVAINQGPGAGPVFNIPALLVKSLFADARENVAVKINPEYKSASQKYVGNYLNNRRSFSKLEKTFSLLNSSASISIDSDGYLVRSMGGKVTSWLETSPGWFSNAENDDVLKFDFDEQGNVLRYNAEAGHYSMEKVSFFENPNFFNLSFLLVIFFSLTTLIGRYARNKKNNNKNYATKDTLGLIVPVASLLFVLLIAIVATNLASKGIADWPNGGVKMLVWCADILALLYVVMAVDILSVWRANWKITRKIIRSVYTISTLGLAYALWVWNIIGFSY